jgi:S-adenosylmethionine:tRNA-ribosyltransferase-isomerase (queuine synthetase)
MSVAAFTLPPELEATTPPELRGAAGREDVRLLVGWRSDGRLFHGGFVDLWSVLEAGDLLVINTSAAIPAAVRTADLDVRFSSRAPHRASEWLVELRLPDGDASVPYQGGEPGDEIALPGEARLTLVERYEPGSRLWRAIARLPLTPLAYFSAYGEPVRYGHARERWPLEAYQNVYANEPGGAEMPSAGRPFTPEILTRLVAGGVLIAPLVLHCGVSSPDAGEPPAPEPFRVPAATARLVNATRLWGRRVIAVGTTVVRALESAADEDGIVRPTEGFTELVIDAERGVHAVDGLLTGFHEPEASHLDMLEAIAGPELVEKTYREALEHGYLWHEFGDSNLVLP